LVMVGLRRVTIPDHHVTKLFHIVLMALV